MCKPQLQPQHANPSSAVRSGMLDVVVNCHKTGALLTFGPAL